MNHGSNENSDATTIAMHAISGARDGGYDVVLIDTAGKYRKSMKTIDY